MRVAFYTLGCKVNQYETISLSEQFVSAGFELTDPADIADIYVLNSCTVTGESDKKSRQLLRRFRRQNENAIIAICGCFPQAFPEDTESISEADIVLGTANKKMLLDCVQQVMTNGERVVAIEKYSKDDSFEGSQVNQFGDKTRAFVKIQDGCERFCAYCIIPFARGPVRSKPIAELKDEINKLAKSGHKEVVLVGINLSCYGTDFGGHLLNAIETACSVDGIERVRLGSLEPELLDIEAIKRMGKQPKLCPQFHLSLQSGCDATLARMRRHYTTKDYTEIVNNLRSVFDNCAITTDIMVGFPGETDDEFNQSLEYVKGLGLARAHVFSYSRRSGTTADKMPDQIDSHVKTLRNKAMTEVVNLGRAKFLQSQIGRVEEVLFEGSGEKGWEGYSKNYTTVFAPSEDYLRKTILKVKIENADQENCYGTII